MKDSLFLSRAIIRNYKSIESCDVELSPLTFLIGPSAAGKSNFLDALQFVSDSLRTTLNHAIRNRGGINDVRRRSGGHPTHFGMRLEFTLDNGFCASYYFKIGARPHGAYEVQEEDCLVWYPDDAVGHDYFRVRSGEVFTSLKGLAPPALPDSLYLMSASSLAPFRPAFDALSHMGTCNPSPAEMRRPQPASAGELLAHDGGNIASVLEQLSLHHPATKERVEAYLRKIVPGIQGVDVMNVGPLDALEFRQVAASGGQPWRFMPHSISDGTLRALGILVALFQMGNGGKARVPLVGIEEPEIALHPAAAGVLLESVLDASAHRQVLVTSHSPKPLDDERIESILSVVADAGATRIRPIDVAGRARIRERLHTAEKRVQFDQMLEGETAGSVTRWDQMPLQFRRDVQPPPDHS